MAATMTESQIAPHRFPNLETVVGIQCMLNVIQKQGSKGGTFANIAGIMPLAKDSPTV